MAKKIFVTYKCSDSGVLRLLGVRGVTTARDCVNLLQAQLDANDHINKGEDDGEDLSDFRDETIASHLRENIYDSTITLILISKNMKEPLQSEEAQWMPWEISYSLREKTREDRTSRANAVLAVVIPDETGSYQYFIQDNTCPQCHCRMLLTPSLFKIIRDNMINHKTPTRSPCANHAAGTEPFMGDHSYIGAVKWADFISNVNAHLDTAPRKNQNIEDYNISKEV